MVTAIDPTEEGIQVAQEHLKRDPALSDHAPSGGLLYRCCTTDDLLQDNNKMEDDKMANSTFDCVVASEVVEHVRNVHTFVEHLSSLVKVSYTPYTHMHFNALCDIIYRGALP